MTKPASLSPTTENQKPNGEAKAVSSFSFDLISKALFENNLDAVFSLDLEGNFTSANPACERISGYRVDELIGSSFTRFVVGESIAGALDRFMQLIRGEPQDLEVTITHKDGHLVDLQLTGIPIVVGDKTVGAFGIAKDVTDRSRAESALRESEERLRLAMEGGRMGAWDWNLETNEVRWSEGLERIFGMEAGTFAGTFDAFLREVHPEDREGVQRQVGGAIAKGDHEIEYRLLPKNGRTRWLLSKGQSVYDQDGKAVRMLGMCIDITERKLAEERLRDGEERLRLAMEAGQMGAWDWNLETNEVRWSEGLELIHGLDPGGFAGTFEAFMADVHPDDREYLQLEIGGALARGTHDVEYRIIPPHGRMRWVAGKGQALYDDAGKAVHMIGVCIDITERKRAEEQLRESETRYRELVEALGVAVYTTDADGRITLFNDAAADFWGRRPELGKDEWCGSLRLYWPDGAPMSLDECPMAVALRENRPVRGQEAVVERPDGSRASFLPYPTPLRDASGAVVGAVNVLMDITERKRAEEQVRRASEAKDEFLGMMSHELRTPITTIYGGARLLRTRGDALDEESRRELLSDIEQETERLHRLVEDLLVLSRLELDKRVPTEPVLIQHLARRAADGLRKRNREVQVTIEAGLPPVAGDQTYLEQVLRNLLSNAHKYSPNGEPITVRAERRGDEVIVSVVDGGPGVAEEEVERIFDRFYRSDETAKVIGGAGIGLTVCKRLIEAQAGRIWARLADGRGLEVSFALPVHEESIADER